MDQYIVNKNNQTTSEHEVHNVSKGCNFLPERKNRLDLGFHYSCESALEKAREHYSEVDGCYYYTECCHSR